MSLDDHELEDRLRAHLRQQADAIHIEPAYRPDQRNRSLRHRGGRSSSGLTLVAAAAVVIIAGLGFAALTGALDNSGTEEIATVPDDETNSDQDANQDQDDGQDSAEDQEDQAGTDDGQNSLLGGAEGPLATRFDVVDITNSSSPGAFTSYDVDDGVYIVLSTAPGRVPTPTELATPAELDAYDALLAPRTFYVLDPTLDGQAGQTWQSATVPDRYIAGFEVADGVLYAVSTGLTTGDRSPAVGLSSDRGTTWEWRPLPELSEAQTLDLDVLGVQVIVAGYTPASVNIDEAESLARQAGFDGASEDFYFATNAFYEYQAPNAETSSRVWWRDVGVEPPSSWDPWVGLFRYDLADDTVAELPLPLATEAGEDLPTRFLALDRSTGSGRERISFEAWPASDETEPSWWALTGDSAADLGWVATTPSYFNTSGSAGSSQFVVDQPGTLPQLRRSTDGGPWETLSAEELVPGQGVVSGAVLNLRDSRYGLFVDFNAFNGPSTVVATLDGETWQAFATEFDNFSVYDGDGELLLIGDRWLDDPTDGIYRPFTYVYRLTPADS
jgi:hypothetical protein